MSSQKWEFDPVHSNIGFSVRHLVVSKVHGRFSQWSGTLLVDEDNPSASSVDVEIDAASIYTHDETRDNHLRSADFFDVEKFPTLNFRSNRVEVKAPGRLLVIGDLTMHGITQPVELDLEYHGQVEHPQMGKRAGFSAHTSVLRKDFGIVFNQILDNGGLALGDRVDIALDVEALVPVPVPVPVP